MARPAGSNGLQKLLYSAGWFNLLGQVAVTAGIDFALTNQIAAMWVLSNDYILTQGQLLAVYTGAALPVQCFQPSSTADV